MRRPLRFGLFVPPSDSAHQPKVEATLVREGDDPELLARTYRRDQMLEQHRSDAVVSRPQAIVDAYGRLLPAFAGLRAGWLDAGGTGRADGRAAA